jgi:undecaprenyl-diphosphatase
VGVAFLAAAVTGFVVVKWLMGYIKSHKFTAFAHLPHRAGRGAAAVVAVRQLNSAGAR